MTVPRSIWFAILVALAAFAPYVGTLNHVPLSDDPILIREVARLDREGGLRRVLTADFRVHPTIPLGYYRPVILLSIWADTRIGIPPPWSHHVTNLLLHVLISVLLFLVARNLCRSDGAALLSGLLFAVHPVHVDAVAPVAGRTDLWTGVFVLTATLSWTSTTGRDRPTPYWVLVVGSVAVALAALSKESGFIAPMVFGAWHAVHFRRKSGFREVLSTGRPWIVAWGTGLLAALAIRWLAIGFGVGDKILAVRGSPGLIFGIWARYFRLLLLPWPLNAFYTPDQVSLDALTCFGAVAVLLLYGTLSRRRFEYIGVMAFAWTVLFLLPVSGIVTLPAAVLAERFLYVPSVAFCILAGFILHQAWNTMRLRRIGALAITLLLVAAGSLTLARSRDWQNPLRFYSNLVQTSPRYAGGYEGLGQALEQAEQRDEALAAYQKSLRLDPGRASTYNSLGVFLANAEAFGEAVPLFRKAVLLEPNFTEARMNLGVACLALHERSCAIEQIDALRALDAEAAARLQTITAEADRRERVIR